MTRIEVNEFNEFNIRREAMANRKIQECAQQVADFCREQIEAGAMTVTEANEFGNKWMADVQDRVMRSEGF